MYKWSAKSQIQYDTLSKDLQLLSDTVLLYHDCSILWGNRNKEIQNALYNGGKSKLKYPESKHNLYPSEAVDLIPYRKGWNPFLLDQKTKRYGSYFSGLVVAYADSLYFVGRMEKKIRWGGNWSIQRDKPFASFYDGFHFESYT